MTCDVLIASCFGRENWIAAELVAKGYSVHVVDFTSGFGPWAPEDAEGPFGVLRSESMTSGQFYRLSEDDDLVPIEEGLVLWPKSGPIELRGPLSAHQLKSAGIIEDVLTYLYSSESYEKQTREGGLRDRLKKKSFDDVWLAHFGHRLASNVVADFPISFDVGPCLALAANFYLRRPTRRGGGKLRHRLEEKGIKWTEGQKLSNMILSGKSVQNIEIELTKGEKKYETVEPRDVVWLLSGPETKHLGGTVSEKVFASKIESPMWSWVRYRLRFDPHRLIDVMPNWVALVEDVHRSWTHDNLLIFHQTSKSFTYDVWALIADERRSELTYLEELSKQISSRICERIPGCSILQIEYPQSYHYGGETLGPAAFGLFSVRARRNQRSTPIENLWLGGIESLDILDWSGFFHRQTEIVKILDMAKEKAQEIKRKREKSQEARP